MATEKIKVSLDFGQSVLEVGTLLVHDQQIYFRYAPSFLQTQLDISPFKLKKTSEIITCPKEPFDGLPGVFNDSIPDGWGRLLLDRKLIERGINPKEISVLDRLSFLGRNAQGALIYEPFSADEKRTFNTINLDVISNEAQELLKNGSAALLDDLYHLGGNSVGAEPKIFVNYNEQSEAFTLNPEKESAPWIIKFPALNDFKDISKIEFAYYQMAIDCGIIMNPSKLFFSENGNTFFGTKRFDIQNGKRLHLHSACGLLHDNFRLSTLDYGQVMDAANRLENKLSACEKVFRLAVFNICALNMDDHSKNIAFLMDERGVWKLAPAYDLTFSPSPGGYQSLSVANEYRDIKKSNLLILAEYFGIKQAGKIIDEVKESLSNWLKYASMLEINKNESSLIEKAIKRKLKDL